MPPSPSRKDRKRAEIVGIARDLFFETGYAGTSMSQIAAAVGGSKATLYNHFQSKEELLLAVVEEVVQPGPADYDPRHVPTEFRAWLVWWATATVRKVTSPPYVALQRLAAAEAVRCPEIGKMISDAVMGSVPQVTQPVIAAMEKGLIRRGDPNLALEHFLEMCLGWMLRGLIWNIRPAPTKPEIDRAVGNALSTFMDGWVSGGAGQSPRTLTARPKLSARQR